MNIKKALREAVYLELERQSQVDLAKKIGISQSTISRAKNMDWQYYRGSIRKLGDYLEIVQAPTDPRKNATLMKALQDVWDGSNKDASKIAKYLYAINDFRVPKR